MFPFMTTSQPLIQSHIQQTLFAVDFLAKTSAQQVNKPASNMALGLASFTNSFESFAWYSPNTSCWKTSQRSLLTDWTPFSESWPKQGLMRNGRAYRQVLWAPAINAIAGGALPTPRANSAMTVNLRTQQDGPELQRNLETVMAWMLPTPCTTDFNDATYHHPPSAGNTRGEKLAWAVGKHLKHNNGLTKKRGETGSILTGKAMYLNPSFVEEMMGFPVGWTV